MTRRFHPAAHAKRQWAMTRRRIFHRDQWRCRMCGEAGRLECAHIVDIQDGGSVWDESNLRALCRGCHRAETIAKRRQRMHPMAQAWNDFVDTL